MLATFIEKGHDLPLVYTNTMITIPCRGNDPSQHGNVSECDSYTRYNTTGDTDDPRGVCLDIAG